jgi:AcrR family transcriptional regulator
MRPAGSARTRRAPRRSHAERTAETRALILDAVVRAIDEIGVQRTTAVEIARRAGVTWGAVQHHFGGKDGILIAVLERSFADFAARLADLDAEQLPLGERARLFVERAWQHFASAEYRSSFEILLGYGDQLDDAREPAWRVRFFDAWDREWQRLFGDAPIARRKHHLLQHYAFSVLSGLATSRAFEGGGTTPRPGALELLTDTLARELAGERA